MKIIPIIIGTHKKEAHPKGYWLPGHTGAVTLLQNKDHNILVDTGARGTFEKTTHKLETLGLTVNDIDIVILTHLHLDHAFNVSEFKNAQIYAWNHQWTPEGTLRLNNFEIKDIEIIQTPGHAEEHISVLVKDEEKKTAIISGDAINQDYLNGQKITAFTYDEALYHQSAQKILAKADYIIPGHGPQFLVKKD